MEEHLRRLVRAQHGLLSRRQAIDAGLTAHQVRHRVRSGLWAPQSPGVYLDAHFAPTWRSRVLAACLRFNALAGHRTAGVLHGLESVRARSIEIVLPHGWRRPVEDICIRQTTQPELVDRTEIDAIPCTGLGRTVLDLAAVMKRHEVEAVVDEVLRTKRLTLGALWDVLVAHSIQGRTGCGRLRPVLDDRLGHGTIPLSDWSRMVSRLLVRHGLPRPSLEHRVHGSNGRFVAQVDLAYAERRVAIELDSVAFHLNRDSFEHDPRRRNRLTVAGWTVLTFTWADYIDGPEVLCATVRAALRGSRGAPGA